MGFNLLQHPTIFIQQRDVGEELVVAVAVRLEVHTAPDHEVGHTALISICTR
jgi:hypothetical protein